MFELFYFIYINDSTLTLRKSHARSVGIELAIGPNKKEIRKERIRQIDNDSG